MRVQDRPKPTASRYCPLWTFRFGLPHKVFKTWLLERHFHTLIKNALFFVLLSNQYEISESTPFGAQRPCLHTASCGLGVPHRLEKGTSVNEDDESRRGWVDCEIPHLLGRRTKTFL